MVGFTVLPYLTGLFGWIYLVAALASGIGFVAMAADLARRPTRAAAVRLHLASLAYLALLFGAMAADRVILA
jgi:protoheme IX farnesyltransferase